MKYKYFIISNFYKFQKLKFLKYNIPKLAKEEFLTLRRALAILVIA